MGRVFPPYVRACPGHYEWKQPFRPARDSVTKNNGLSKSDEMPLLFRTFVDSLLPGKKWCYNESTGNTQGKKE